MKRLTATICLTIAVHLGSAGVSWGEWKPLAEHGDASAQYTLGLMYARGDGVPQDYKTAVKWFRLAAEQGNALAQYNLGGMYARGDGVPRDYKTAVKWWRLAAKQGFANAQKNLKRMKSRLVSDGIDKCLFDEVQKITGPETKRIVEKYCRMQMKQKSLDWLILNVN